eukprot:7388015-Prymnesium_polylepis.1
MQRTSQCTGRVAFGVAKGHVELRVWEQPIVHAVKLIVDLCQRLIHTNAWRPGHGDVFCRFRSEHGQEHSQSDDRHNCRRKFWWLAVVRGRISQHHAFGLAPPILPVTRCCSTGRPQARSHGASTSVDIIEKREGETNPAVAVVSPTRIRRRIKKFHPAGHAPEVHLLDQGVQELASHNCGAILQLNEIVQSVCNGERRVICEAVRDSILHAIVASANDWSAAVLVMIVRPQ